MPNVIMLNVVALSGYPGLPLFLQLKVIILRYFSLSFLPKKPFNSFRDTFFHLSNVSLEKKKNKRFWAKVAKENNKTSQSAATLTIMTPYHKDTHHNHDGTEHFRIQMFHRWHH